MWSYQEAKRKAKEFYASIGRVWCPALGEFIAFNRIGFQHLIRKQGMVRAKGEQKRRFGLIPLAVNLIQSSDIKTKHQRRETAHWMKIRGEHIQTSSLVDFWELTKLDDDRKVKVIIRQFSGREKHFLSVYEKKKNPLQDEEDFSTARRQQYNADRDNRPAGTVP